MRPTVGLFQSATQSLKNVDFFDKLPAQLQRYFQRFPPIPFKQYSNQPTLTSAEDANPFLPNKNPITNKYQNPVYSLRRQSILYKLAFQHGIQDSLPVLQNNKIFYQEKYDKNEFMKGVLRPKGRKYERNREQRKAKIQEALAKADEKIISVKGNKYKRLLERRSQKGKSWI